MTKENFRLSCKTACYNQNPKTTGQCWFKLIFKYYFAYEFPCLTQLPKCGKTANLGKISARKR